MEWAGLPAEGGELYTSSVWVFCEGVCEVTCVEGVVIKQYRVQHIVPTWRGEVQSTIKHCDCDFYNMCLQCV